LWSLGFAVLFIFSYNSPADKGMNRAFDDKSMKFGTHLEETLRKIFGYRAIAHFARNKNGSHFQNGCPLFLHYNEWGM
jgi:hypothetical protein